MLRRKNQDNGLIYSPRKIRDTGIQMNAIVMDRKETHLDAKHDERRTLQHSLKVTACVVGIAMLTGYGSAIAQQTTLTPDSPEALVAAMPLGELERAFWVCDYTATVAGVHATPVALCAAVWDEIKQTKFGGSFPDLLAWWQSSKAAEHAALATATVAYRAQD